MTYPVPPAQAERQRPRRRRLLRTLLLKFLKRLKKACEVLETPAQWYEVTKELRGLLNDYRDVLPSSDRDTLWLATLLTDQTHTGITQACAILQSRLATVIATLPAAGLAAPALLVGALVVAVTVAVAAVVLNLTSITLSIQNINCERFAVTGVLPVAMPGLELPEFVATNTTETAQLPPIALNTRRLSASSIVVTLFGVPLNFDLPARVQSVLFDGVELLSGAHTFELGLRKEHTLVIRCG